MIIFSYGAIILTCLIFLIYPFDLKKKNINYSHQLFTTDFTPPLLGGFFLIYIFLLNFDISIIEKILYFSIFFIGTLSDFKFLNSPKLRLILQIIIILSFVKIANLHLENTRLHFLDEILKSNYFNILFCTFCIIILVNGTNFIDGLNGLVIGYYLTILIIIFSNQLYINIVTEEFIVLFIFLLFLMFILNQLNKIYLGDSGSYLIAFFTATFLIQIYIENQNISPFFIILLIWYPCFENLFSISRKLKFNSSPLNPDNYHLHQLLFKFFKQKTNLNKKTSNNLTSILIIFYNLIIVFLGSLSYQNTKFQVGLLILNLIIYISLYILLGLKIKYKKIY